jgi:hypothetical protein
MNRNLTAALLPVLAVGLSLSCGQVLAWGATGHRLIAREAMASLPAEAPAFLRTSAAIDTVGELGREPDRWKGAGKTHDTDRDPAHFVDVGDDGAIFGGPALGALPETREAYDAALRIAGTDSWKAGYLPYAIIDGWQQLVVDFGVWRVDTAVAAKGGDPVHRAWFVADGLERQALILRDLGVLAHYVGDGSQPLHVTVHFNGWGPGPNVEHFTQQKVHAGFEGDFVRRTVTPLAVRSLMTPYADCRCKIEQWTSTYLTATNGAVTSFYRLQKAGGFTGDDLRGASFAAARLAAGASALRDVVVDAWRASASARVGWPSVAVSDVENRAFDPYDSLYGAD